MTSPILFEIFAGVLTIWKAWIHAHALCSSESFPILHSLLRDGIFYCTIMIILRTCNAFIWVMLPSGSAYLGLYLLWAPLSVMSTRFYLNIKSAATFDPFSPRYPTSMQHTTTFRFNLTRNATSFALHSEQDTAMLTLGSTSRHSNA
ncbi:hypothetical protein FRC20_011335 [Serendipita sp. 405]|nr:hypothetical protein FRC18_012075 [Serendipita sp. 400]KAG8870788.1 hypothetical protein FRC20_011335 [Serendipita sp. 405]